MGRPLDTANLAGRSAAGKGLEQQGSCNGSSWGNSGNTTNHHAVWLVAGAGAAQPLFWAMWPAVGDLRGLGIAMRCVFITLLVGAAPLGSTAGPWNTAQQRAHCAARARRLFQGPGNSLHSSERTAPQVASHRRPGRANRHMEKEPMPAWEGKRDRWLAKVDQKAGAHAAVVLQEQKFWEQAPSDSVFQEADNPSALLQSIVSRWLRWVGGPVQGKAAR